MRLKKSLFLLSLTSVLVLSSHIGWIRGDLGLLLTIDDRPIDVVGKFEDKLNTLTRNCGEVERLSPSNKQYQLAQSLIHDYSPPDSSNSNISSAWAWGSWILVEVEFKDDSLSISVEKDGETIEDLMIPFSEEKTEEESEEEVEETEDDDIKPFNDFEEEEDFEDGEVESEVEETEEEETEEEEESEGIESFESFLNKEKEFIFIHIYCI